MAVRLGPESEIQVGGVMRWGLVALDRRWHAVDPTAEHFGVFRAACGRLLSMETTLWEMFFGPWCEECALQQLAAVPPPEFGPACLRAGAGDPLANLTFPPRNPGRPPDESAPRFTGGRPVP